VDASIAILRMTKESARLDKTNHMAKAHHVFPAASYKAVKTASESNQHVAAS